MLRALIFDFDGLLVDTETVLIDAWERIHAEDKITARRGHMHLIVGHVDKEHDPWIAYPPDHDRGLLEERYRHLARQMTLDAPLLPGVADLLAAARARGLRLGIASNSTHAHVEGHLAHRGLLDTFDHIACRDDVSAGKPAPDVYLAALRGLGVASAEAIGFEDSTPGHEAAHAAGLRVIVVPNPSTAHCDFPHATRRLASLADTTLETLDALPVSVSPPPSRL